MVPSLPVSIAKSIVPVVTTEESTTKVPTVTGAIEALSMRKPEAATNVTELGVRLPTQKKIEQGDKFTDAPVTPDRPDNVIVSPKSKPTVSPTLIVTS